MKTCKRPLGWGADDGATVKGSSCDKERGDLVEPRTVRLVVIDGAGAGAGVGVDINIIIRFWNLRCLFCSWSRGSACRAIPSIYASSASVRLYTTSALEQW